MMQIGAGCSLCIHLSARKSAEASGGGRRRRGPRQAEVAMRASEAPLPVCVCLSAVYLNRREKSPEAIFFSLVLKPAVLILE